MNCINKYINRRTNKIERIETEGNKYIRQKCFTLIVKKERKKEELKCCEVTEVEVDVSTSVCPPSVSTFRPRPLWFELFGVITRFRFSLIPPVIYNSVEYMNFLSQKNAVDQFRECI